MGVRAKWVSWYHTQELDGLTHLVTAGWPRTDTPPPPQEEERARTRAEHAQFIAPKYTKLIIDNGSTSPGQREEGAEGGQNCTYHTLSMRKAPVGMQKELSPQW